MTPEHNDQTQELSATEKSDLNYFISKYEDRTESADPDLNEAEFNEFYKVY